MVRYKLPHTDTQVFTGEYITTVLYQYHARLIAGELWSKGIIVFIRNKGDRDEGDCATVHIVQK